MTPRDALACGVVALSWGCSDEAVLHLFPPEACVDAGCNGTETVSTASGGSTSTMSTTVGPTGAGGAPSGCGPLVDRVQVSYPSLPTRPVPSNEYHPMVLAAKADDSSLLAYREQGAVLLRIVELSASGQFVREIQSFEGEEAHALLAHESGGGAFVYMREDDTVYSPEYCRGPDDPTQNYICGSMQLVGFDDGGSVLMESKLTDDRRVAEEDAYYMYWFQHTARIVWADDSYGIYFRVARTLPAAAGGGLISTDRLLFVDSAGNRRTDRGWVTGGPGVYDGGCFYSWSVRLAYNNGLWAAACHSDTIPDAHRIVVIDQDGQRETTFLEGINPLERALGGLVPAGDGFWLSYLEPIDDALQLHLTRVTPAPTLEEDRIIPQAQYLDSVYVFRPYLAKYGDDLLLGWQSNDQLVLAVADFDTGQVVEGPVATEAPIDDFVDFVSYPSGDVGWAHSTNTGEVTVTRVLSCSE